MSGGTRAGTGVGMFLYRRGLGLGPGGPYMVRSNASWIMVTWDPCGQNDRQTDMTENITFPQLRWRAVITVVVVRIEISPSDTDLH